MCWSYWITPHLDALWRRSVHHCCCGRLVASIHHCCRCARATRTSCVTRHPFGCSRSCGLCPCCYACADFDGFTGRPKLAGPCTRRSVCIHQGANGSSTGACHAAASPTERIEQFAESARADEFWAVWYRLRDLAGRCQDCRRRRASAGTALAAPTSILMGILI